MFRIRTADIEVELQSAGAKQSINIAARKHIDLSKVALGTKLIS